MRDMVKQADDIMKLVGTHGSGINPNTGLPVDVLTPMPPPGPPPSLNGDQQERAAPMYRSATTALTVVFNQKAVQDIIHASADEITKAFYNAKKATENIMMSELVAQAAVKTVGQHAGEQDPAQSARVEIASLASTAAKIVQDLVAVASAKTPEEQAAAFSRVLAGSGKSGLAYENILKVLVQLIDPMDISAEFCARTDKHIKGEKDVKARYILNDRKVSDDKLLGQMLDARKRFVEPTKLTD
jgi:hypothetical protein